MENSTTYRDDFDYVEETNAIYNLHESHSEEDPQKNNDLRTISEDETPKETSDVNGGNSLKDLLDTKLRWSDKTTDPFEDDSPEKIFSDVSKQFDSNFKSGFRNSFIDGSSDGRVREYGGVIIKRKTESGIEYKMINEKISKSPARYKHDFSGIPEGWQVAGEYHTHPYSQKDIDKDWGHYENWDGEGMPFSIEDLKSLAYNRRANNGYISIVEAGNKRFGLVVSDKKKNKPFMRKAEGALKEKLYYEDQKVYDGTSEYSHPGVMSYDMLEQTITEYENETRKSAGVQLFSHDVNQ